MTPFMYFTRYVARPDTNGNAPQWLTKTRQRSTEATVEDHQYRGDPVRHPLPKTASVRQWRDRSSRAHPGSCAHRLRCGRHCEAPPRPFTYGETQAPIRADIDGIFAPQIVGMSPLEREAIRAKLIRRWATPPPRPPSTWRCVHAMDDLDLGFPEELCPADNVIGRQWLVSQSRILIFADESASRPGEVARELLA